MIEPDTCAWPGLYRTWIVRRGHPVAASIAFVEGFWTAEINGDPQGEWTHDGLRRALLEAATEGEAFHHPILRVLLGERVDPAEYHYLRALAAYARANDPDRPAPNPERPIDLRALPSLF